MAVTASAPGKLLLLGDHAVVYDRPCLVTAVNLRYTVELTRVEDKVVEIITPELTANSDKQVTPVADLGAALRPQTAFVEAACARLYRQHQLSDGLRVVTQGPRVSYGLGSSSAVTAATVAAVSALNELGLSQREMFDIAYRAVLDVQGKGSGFDVAAAIYGGTLHFVTGGAVIEPLDLPDLPIVIGYSGAKVGTRGLVGQVAELRESHPEAVNGIFDLVQGLVTKAKTDLTGANWSGLGTHMNIHQGLLDALGVNTLSLSRLIFAAREAGAYGAKLSGAGGGDCMYAVADPAQQEQVRTAIEQAGGKIVALPTGARGVYVL